MNLDQFRIMYSELIENYQYIEMHLKDIYAILNCDSGCVHDHFYEHKMLVDEYSLTRIFKNLKNYDDISGSHKINDSIYSRLEAVCNNRNYWCHSCFTDMVFDRKTGLPKAKYIERLFIDFRESQDMRDLLFEIKMKLN